MAWADLIVLSDNIRLLYQIDRYRAKGFPIFGASRETAAWETDRSKGQGVFANAGILTALSVPFTSYKAAAGFASRHTDTRFVCKPNGGKADKSLSYVSKSTRDLLFMLKHWKANIPGTPDFVLQKFIPGAEFAVGGWFGPGGWAGQWLENFEFKKFLTGNLGPNCGEACSLVKYVEHSRLADELLAPLTGELFRQKYVGYIDVSCIIDSRGRPWPLEFTTRFGYPTFQVQSRLHPDPALWMKSLVDGDSESIKFSDKTAAGVRIYLPKMPYDEEATAFKHSYPLYTPATGRNSIHPDTVMLGEVPDEKGVMSPGWVSAGSCPLVVTGVGDSVTQAAEEAYKVVKKIEIPASPMYRIDAGCTERLEALWELGYAEDWYA
jgi:phosphoribosylamine--glycine ligase